VQGGLMACTAADAGLGLTLGLAFLFGLTAGAARPQATQERAL